jgi:acetyl-CoA carboxylase carboxyl transferase subunit beta
VVLAKGTDEQRGAVLANEKKGRKKDQGQDGTSSEEAAKDAPRRGGRLARLRFSKKKDMPGGLWLKCESCGEVIFRKDLEDSNRVCPECSFHFTVPGKERLRLTLDEGTWKEEYVGFEGLDRLGFVDSQPYEKKLARAVQRSGQTEAFLCGTGAILGREVVVGILDFAFMGGSMGEVVGEKVALSCEMAGEKGLPLIIFTSSGGARMHEGILSLMQMAKTCSALQEYHEKGGFSICVMTHPTTGGVTASFASVTDLVLGEPGALIGFAGPRVIATTLKQELPPGFQRSEFLLEKGMLDAIVTRSDMRETLARLLTYASGRKVQAAGSSAVSVEEPA